ncbi:MAG: hypothetical protein Ct9H300mP28_01610 [Pseudomonadota bacterium]|nr:MAG: hypothetical protein Ct9H300mP28_01610 [Pseudomonadota bacterium]
MIERAEMLPQIESFCADNELGQLQFVALDRPASASQAMENSGVPLPKILKIEEPLQEWGTKFFSRFYLLNDERTFGMNLETTGRMLQLKCFPHQEFVCQMFSKHGHSSIRVTGFFTAPAGNK